VAFDQHLEALSRQVAPSVVQVISSGYAAGGRALLARARSYGSGAIVDADGWIVTNAHVIEGARTVHVELLRLREPGEKGSILRPRSRRLPARVVGADLETDLAVLKVEAAGLPALPLGDSDELRQGQLVLAFGSPLGLENSASLGIVSTVARQLAPDSPMIYVQTDASINPGNSGGPLVDAWGRMVGLNTLIATQSGGHDGIGFAAPSNIVRAVVSQIRESGRVRRGVIGVRAQTITPKLGDGLGLGVRSGVVLSDVDPDGPAAAAGLRPGDVILSLDGKPMENARQLDVNVYQHALGDTVALDVVRGGVRRSYTVTVVERPRDPERFSALVTPERNLIPRLGVLAIELDAQLARAAGPLRRGEGVLVAARSGAIPGTEYDLQPGDVIYASNGVSVRSLAELRSAVGRPARGESLVFQVERGGKLLYVVVDLE
jgi:serine protease Do